MNPDSPLSQLVLWVPPALAAAWEQLLPEKQQALTHALVQWLASKLLAHPAPRSLRELVDVQALTVAELTVFVKELEAKYGKWRDIP